MTLTAGADQASPARTLGTTYVVDQNGEVVAANNQSSLVKSKLITFTFKTALSSIKKVGSAATAEDLDGLGADASNADTYYVAVKASDNIRVGTSRSGGTGDNGYVGTYSPDTNIQVGTLKVWRGLNDTDNAIAYSYAPVVGSDSNLAFYYSVSAQNDTADESTATAASYGTLTVSISKNTF